MNDIHVNWNPKKIDHLGWNEICCRITEQFGLPGDRYVTEVSENYMKFKFRDDQDSLMCRMLLSEYL